MINPLEEKKMLIESMKKLVSHVANNPQRQGQIFHALSTQDLNKVIINLRDDNEYLRRISALLLCQLFFMNDETKEKATKILNLVPSGGRICLGGIPESISKYPSTLKRCLELMKMPLEEGEEDKMCWVINLERKILKVETMEYKKYSSFTFLDPHKNIFGFTISKRTTSKSPQKPDISNMRLSRGSETQSPHHQPYMRANQVNSDFYNKYVDAKRKTSQSKRNSFQANYINLSNTNQTDRPSVQTTQIKPTPHINVTMTPTAKKQSLRNSMDYSVKYNPNLTMTVGRSGFNVQKFVNSTHIPGHYSNSTQLNTTHQGKFEYTQPKKEQLKIKGSKYITGVSTPNESSRQGNTMSNKDRFYNKMKEVLHQ